MDPIAFLNARLDEEAAGLEAQISGDLERYRADGLPHLTREEMLTPQPPEYLPEHPRRFREIEAKRVIVAEHQPMEGYDFESLHGQICETCAGADMDGSPEGSPYPCPTVRALLTIWSDHPEYRQDWALSEPVHAA